MLTKCPECELQISDKAIVCPHCGYPLQNSISKIAPRKKLRKRKRLPNGFGQISEIKGKYLRKPFRAMVTVGKTPEGRPICKPLKPDSYFETYNDAYAALVEYNRNPYDLDEAISVLELYNKWSAYYFPTLKSDSSIRTIKSAWAYCSSLHSMRAKDLRARHIKAVIDEGYRMDGDQKIFAPASAKARIKSLFNLMMDYAVEYEIVNRNYARTFDLSNDVVEELEKAYRGHIPFTAEEINKLWENINYPYVDILLIQCYSGWRPQELGLIELKDVDLEQWTFTGGMKSDAGRNRIVPIHSKIKGLVKARYDEAVRLDSKYLFNCTDTSTHRSSLKLTYDKYKSRHNKIRDALGLNPEHRPHDGRKHFVTACKKAKVDDFAIKYMVGHEIDDITEKVYTQREISWLAEEIEKIK